MENSENISEFEENFGNLKPEETEFREKCKKLVEDIVQERSSLLDLVEKLGSLLTARLVDKRVLGVTILSNVIEKLPIDYLNSSQLSVVVNFYADRVRDYHNVFPPVLDGIVALLHMQNLDHSWVTKLLRAVFEHIPCQQQQLDDRKKIYKILELVINSYVAEAQKMGPDFILGVVSAMDGERDPRCLLQLFGFLSKLLQAVRPGHLTEEVFDVISCYFPIDFKVPTQDKKEITREELAKALCPCLCAVPEFSEQCISLLLEKLSSSLPVAKLDSLELLAESCKTFSWSTYIQYSDEIWSQLQRELFSFNDEQLQEACLKAVSAICSLSSRNGEDCRIALNKIITTIYESVQGNLRPDARLFAPSTKLLLAIAGTSEETCKFIVPRLLSLLVNQFNISADVKDKVVLIDAVIGFVSLYSDVCKVTDVSADSNLTEIGLYIQAACDQEPELSASGFRFISAIIKILPKTTRDIVYKLILSNLVLPVSPLVRNSLLECLKTTVFYFQGEILCELFTGKPNGVPPLELYLEALAYILNEDTYVVILPHIAGYCVSRDIAVARVSLKCLRRIIENNIDNEEIHNFLFVTHQLVSKLIVWFLCLIDSKQATKELLIEVSYILEYLVRFQLSDVQSDVIDRYYSPLMELMHSEECEDEGNYLILLGGLLIPIRKDVEIPNDEKLFGENSPLMATLVYSSTSVEVECAVHKYLVQFFANVVNKSSYDVNYLDQIVDRTFHLVTMKKIRVEDNDMPCEGEIRRLKLYIQSCLSLLTWYTKALLTKGCSCEHWMDRLISFLEVYEEMGKNFRIIMDDSYSCLSTKNHCNIRLFYQQRFFEYVCKRFLASEEIHVNYLTALGYMISVTPASVLKKNFNSIIRLIILCLESSTNVESLSAVLNTISDLIMKSEPILEQHINAFIPRLLKLAQFQKSMNVRIIALKCITNYCSQYPVYKLLPHKQEVIYGLMPCLDDPKRLVRKEAVVARCRWYLLDAPT